MSIIKRFNEAAFDAETTAAMGQAYDSVCLALAGNAFVDSTPTKEKIAGLIIRYASDGERNPSMLAANTLEAMGMNKVHRTA